MPTVKLTQETVLKHFMERNSNIPVNSSQWQQAAIQNHVERGGTGTMPTNTNTLLLIEPNVWTQIINGSYFGDHSPPPPNAQLALTIDKEDIDRIITTRKNGSNYDVIDDLVPPNVVDATFLCNYDATNQVYSITHFEGLGN